MKIAFGLGNPGVRYHNTRHNLGFHVVDRLAAEWKAVPVDSGLPAETLRAEPFRPGEPVWLVKPLTFMNLSGRVVRLMRNAAEFTGFEPADCLVVTDDVYLPFGKLRLRASGSDGGHNGLASMIEAFGTVEVPRLRIGVGPLPPDRDLKEFVLEEETGAWLEEAAAVVDRAARCAGTCLGDGVARAMNTCNG